MYWYEQLVSVNCALWKKWYRKFGVIDTKSTLVCKNKHKEYWGKKTGHRDQCWTKRNKENLLFWNKVWFNSSVNKWGYFCVAPSIFVVFVLIFHCLYCCFTFACANLIEFQVPYISISLCAEKLRLNNFQGLGITLLIQPFEMTHEAAFHNRHLCGLFTDSLTLSFILYNYNDTLLYIMCRMLWCNVSQTAPLLTHNCWWNILYGWRAAWNSAKQQ